MKGLVCFSFIVSSLAVGYALVANPSYNCDDRNPCTDANIAINKFYFANDDPHYFVQCSEYGRCWVMPCAPGTTWSVSANTCGGGSSGGATVPPNPGSGCASFSVALSPSDLGDTNEEDGRVYFDRIIANNGGNYNVAIGAFIAPSAGAYFLSIIAQYNVTYLDGDEGDFTVRMYQNSNIIVVAAGDDGETHSASSVINLAAGDTVWIEQDDGKLLQYTTFTGFKLCCGC